MVHTLTMTVNQITEPQRALLVKQAPLTHQKSQPMEWSLPRCRKVQLRWGRWGHWRQQKTKGIKKLNKTCLQYMVLSVQDLVF